MKPSRASAPVSPASTRATTPSNASPASAARFRRRSVHAPTCLAAEPFAGNCGDRTGWDGADRARGKRAEEVGAVGFRENAPVEYHDEAPVGLAADQAAEALLEAQNCLRHRILTERVVELLAAGRHDW